MTHCRSQELKEQNAQLVSELKTMDVKPRDVKNIQQVGTQAKYEIHLIKKDTVIFDTIPVSEYTYTDDWISFQAQCPLISDTCKAKIVTCDSLFLTSTLFTFNFCNYLQINNLQILHHHFG